MRMLTVVLTGVLAGLAGGALARVMGGEPAPISTAAPHGPPPRALGESFERLEVEILRVESRVRELEAARCEARAEDPDSLDASAEAAEDPIAAETVEEDVLEKIIRGPYGSAEERRLYEWLFSRPEEVEDAIERLERAVEQDPRNPDLYVALAAARTVKLATTSPGPEQGGMWKRVEAAYDGALEIEPDHWRARFGKAYGTSMIPAHFGRRPEAIRQFEELVEIQERREPEDRHVEVYVRLAFLLREDGKEDRARDVILRGIRRFPQNRRLAKISDQLGRR
jgi:tetratricopeptide (TPR) repeat protein